MTTRLAFSVLAATLVLAGCGRAPMAANPAALAQSAQARAVQAASVMVAPEETRGVPPQSAFYTVDATVTKILPADTSGLTHQNFVVTTANGEVYAVNNSTTHGSEVTGLKVGMELRIRGTMYNNSGRKGLHWTHKANKPGDAGWIETKFDGRRFE